MYKKIFRQISQTFESDTYHENAETIPLIAAALNGMAGVKDGSKCEELEFSVDTSRFRISHSCKTSSMFAPVLWYHKIKKLNGRKNF